MHTSVSVIIPTFKSTAYLEECLSSVCSQVFTTPGVSFDILIGVDDCADSLKFFKERLNLYKNLRVLYFNQHVGPYVIRNTLAAIAHADYLVFFDSDDIMPPGFLQGLLKPFQMHDIVRFGLKDFIEIFDVNGTGHKVFDKKKISQYQKLIFTQQIFLMEGKPSVLKQLDHLKSKYLRLGKYVNFICSLFTRRRSGVFGIKKSVFLSINGFKAWPVQADVEFINRAQLLKIKQDTLPKELDFARRIHANNVTSDYHFGMGSKIRNEYQSKSKTSIYQDADMVTTANYVEVR